MKSLNFLQNGVILILFLQVTIQSNNTDNHIKLNFAQVRIRKIISENDSTHGIHFRFTGNSKWWTFVGTVSILYKEQAKRFMPLDDDIWFFHFRPDTTIENWICGTVELENIITTPLVPWWEEALNWMTLS